MRRWLKLLLIPLVLALVLVGVQSYYWYQIKSDVDGLIASVRPFVKVEYEGISATFFGPIDLDNVTIQPSDYKEKISIKHISLASPSHTFFLTAHDQLHTGMLTEPVSLSLSGVSYDLNADYAKSLVLFSSGGSSKSLDTLLCGDTGYINQTALQAMGYRHLQGDLELLLDSSANEKLMKLRLRADVPEFMKADLNVWLALQQGGVLKRETLDKAAIQVFGITISDLGYNQRWKAFCAQQEGSVVVDYLDHYRSALAENLGDGDVAYKGARLLDALSSARSDRSIIAARWEPEVPLEIQMLTSPAGADSLFSGIGFALQVNGKVLALLEEEWQVMRALFGGNVRRVALAVVETKGGVVQPEVIKEVEPMEAIIPGVMPIRPPEQRKAFLETPVGDLANYVGSSIKLRTFFGSDMEGTLVDVAAGSISILHQVEQGRATFPVAKDKIALIEVYR